jgi:hypothetical protein
MLLTIVSKSAHSVSSKIAEPFNAHCGHVTGVTNHSSFTILVSYREPRQMSRYAAHKIDITKFGAEAPIQLGEVVAADHEGRPRANLRD